MGAGDERRRSFKPCFFNKTKEKKNNFSSGRRGTAPDEAAPEGGSKGVEGAEDAVHGSAGARELHGAGGGEGGGRGGRRDEPAAGWALPPRGLMTTATARHGELNEGCFSETC